MTIDLIISIVKSMEVTELSIFKAVIGICYG